MSDLKQVGFTGFVNYLDKGDSRLKSVALIPGYFAASALDTFTGILLSLGTLLTLGQNKNMFDLAEKRIKNSTYLLARPFQSILKVINPSIEIKTHVERELRIGHTYLCAQGLISDSIYRTLDRSADVLGARSKGNRWFNIQVASRLTYSLMAVSLVVTRIVDLILGVPLGLAAIATLGRFETLNSWAYRALQAPAILNDLYKCSFYFVNPNLRYISSPSRGVIDVVRNKGS